MSKKDLEKISGKRCEVEGAAFSEDGVVILVDIGKKKPLGMVVISDEDFIGLVQDWLAAKGVA